MYRDEIMHSGVKGMRWGVRKARPSSGNGGGKEAYPEKGYIYSEKERSFEGSKNSEYSLI